MQTSRCFFLLNKVALLLKVLEKCRDSTDKKFIWCTELHSAHAPNRVSREVCSIGQQLLPPQQGGQRRNHFALNFHKRILVHWCTRRIFVGAVVLFCSVGRRNGGTCSWGSKMIGLKIWANHPKIGNTPKMSLLVRKWVLTTYQTKKEVLSICKPSVGIQRL